MECDASLFQFSIDASLLWFLSCITFTILLTLIDIDDGQILGGNVGMQQGHTGFGDCHRECNDCEGFEQWQAQN